MSNRQVRARMGVLCAPAYILPEPKNGLWVATYNGGSPRLISVRIKGVDFKSDPSEPLNTSGLCATLWAFSNGRWVMPSFLHVALLRWFWWWLAAGFPVYLMGWECARHAPLRRWLTLSSALVSWSVIPPLCFCRYSNFAWFWDMPHFTRMTYFPTFGNSK